MIDKHASSASEANSSPPVFQASHNSGERDPSVMPDRAGGEAALDGLPNITVREGFESRTGHATPDGANSSETK